MPELDQSAATIIEMIRLSNAPPADTLTPTEARLGYLQARLALSPDAPAITEIRPLEAQGKHGPITLRLYRDGEITTPRSVFVYFHGGGWVIGDLDTHDVVCRQIAKQTGAIVIAVDYRMGPEHKFPAAVDDCIAATAWIAKNAATLHIDPTRLIVGGDSAGGNLATVTALDARDNHGPAIALQALIYPSVLIDSTSESHHQFAEGYVLTASLMTWFRNHYLATEADRADWRASPMNATTLANLPPALIITAGFDPLRDDGEAYAARLAQSGVPVTLKRFPGQIHGFLTMGRVIPEANQAIAEIAAAMKSRGL